MGLLSAHPVSPLISLHHLDKIEPIFPNVTRVKALKRLKKPITLDSAGLMQQSICYDRPRKWTISVSWGYSVQINRGILPAREIEKPITTFNDWYGTNDENSLTFNTRPYHGNGCQRPYFYLLSNAYASTTNDTTTSVYAHDGAPGGKCKWRMADPSRIRHVEVYKKPDPNLWDKVISLFLLNNYCHLCCWTLQKCCCKLTHSTVFLENLNNIECYYLLV